jgi:16S rRNA (cytosine1402-N4)-methyltransferase
MSEEGKKPERRVRYTGTHPKSFKEKYKELAPDQFSEDVAKVISQGKTPAGMHRSICVTEILDFLNVQPGQIGLDATLGYGGHTTELIKAVLPNGYVYAIDADPIELPKTRLRLENLGYGAEVVDMRIMNFSGIERITNESGPLNFILADLGVSSMQIDNPERGFSFKVDGPLDLRLNPKNGKSAATLLSICSEAELEEILALNSDEPYSEYIAHLIFEKITDGVEVKRTKQLQAIIREALAELPEAKREDEVKKACQRCFQALRIEVNNEFGALESFLEKLPESLQSGGKVAILTFHSGEDRRVKKSFQNFLREGFYSEITKEPIRPSAEECNANPRARSAKLRWAIKA